MGDKMREGTMRKCLNCGEPLPLLKWWQRWLSPPPMHDPNGPDADRCWLLFCERLGIESPPPRPTL